MELTGRRRLSLLALSFANALACGEGLETEAGPPGGPAGLAAGENAPPTVDAGPDQTIVWPDAVLLQAAVGDDGLPDPPGFVFAEWTKVSGPGDVVFDLSFSSATSAVFTRPGTYVLRLTVSDGQLSTADELQVTVPDA